MTTRFGIPFLCVLLTFISPAVEPTASAQPAAANPVVTLTGSLSRSRHGHTATLLSNGQVLVAGGGTVNCSYSGNSSYCYISVNNTAELYDPATGTWRLTGSLSRRAYHSATLLPNGHVLVVGGVNYGVDIGNTYGIPVDTAELYDPVTGVWRPTQSPIAIRGRTRAVRLPGGKVLVVSMIEAVAELFDPSTESWSLTGAPSLRGPLSVLPSGLVLTASGGSSELYDPATETWSRAGNFNMISHIGTFTGTLTLLRNGLVLATGASDWRETAAELYDPATQSWRPTGRLNYGRDGSSYTATPLPNGHVLVAGGYDPSGPDGTLRSMELYDPTTGAWKLMPSLFNRRTFHTATLLPDDKVLFVAGVDGDFDIGTVLHSSAELFDLGLPRPTSLSISPGTVSQGQCYTITVGNGSGMTLDVQYRHEGGLAQTLTSWPRLDESGRAENICTSQQTPIGTFEFTAIRNSQTTQWIPISTSVTVAPP